MNSADPVSSATRKSTFTVIGISGALSVTLGAFAAHALKGKLDGGLITADQLSGFETGVRYQFYHTIAMLLVALLQGNSGSKALRSAYFFFLAGIVLFSGSLYFLTTRMLWNADWLKVLGPVTPLGGLCFIAGWISLCFYRRNKD